MVRERAEQDKKPEVFGANSFSGNSRNPQGKRYGKSESSASYSSSNVYSAEALVVTSKGERYSGKCRYCQNRHWSDKCTKFKTVEERKNS